MVIELQKTAFYNIRITPSQLILTHHRVIVPTSNMLFLHQKCKGNILSFLYASCYVICHSYRIFVTTNNLRVFVGSWKHQEKHKRSWLRCRMKVWLVALYQARRNWLKRIHTFHIPPRKYEWSSLYIPSSMLIHPSWKDKKKDFCVVKNETDFSEKMYGISPKKWNGLFRKKCTGLLRHVYTRRFTFFFSNKRWLVKDASQHPTTGVQTPDTERVSAQSGPREKGTGTR